MSLKVTNVYPYKGIGNELGSIQVKPDPQMEPISIFFQSIFCIGSKGND